MYKESHPPIQTEVGIFSSEKSHEGAEKPPFSYHEEAATVHQLGVFICRNSGERKQIPITTRNEVFFATGRGEEQPSVIYQGSGLIVSNLLGEFELYKQLETSRPLAFFDIEGDFHDNRFLKNVFEYIKRDGEEIHRHRAVFGWQDEHNELQQEDMAIDDIYCLAAATK